MRELLTTELLSVWTDPDTAMEAVGTNLGIFDERVPSPTKALASDERLRNTLFDVLLSLVEGGALEMRPCGDGRHAFRWREDVTAAVSPVEEKTAPPEVAAPIHAPAPPPVASVADAAAAREQPHPPSRPMAQAPLLVVPAVSCLLAILVYVTFDRSVALGIAGALTLCGVIGLARRVPFAGAWTFGLVVAGLLVHFS